MAILPSTSCCLHYFPAGIPSTSQLLSTHANTSQLARPGTRRSWVNNSWKNQSAMGIMTCAVVVISLNTGNLLDENAVAAANMKLSVAAAISEKKVEKWSDKRTCPAWQSNSLETIVPENLPRPSFHRRWEPAAGTYSRIAPPPMKSASSKCFSV